MSDAAQTALSSPAASLRVERPTATLRELTLQKMRAAILDAHFAPGERLVERTLCEELGVSRSVVREVLRHLETEGLVDTLPNQGPIVARLDASTAAQIYEIRALVEGDAARSCALRGDAATVEKLAVCVTRIERAFAAHDHAAVRELTAHFYEQMFDSGARSVAWEIVQSLNARIDRLRALTIASDDRGRQAVAEMNGIVAAIRARDGERARAAATAHVMRVAEIAAALLPA